MMRAALILSLLFWSPVAYCAWPKKAECGWCVETMCGQTSDCLQGCVCAIPWGEATGVCMGSN